MGIPREKADFSYKDYLIWPHEEKWELIEGHPYAMSPALTRIHQEISGELFFQIKSYLKGKTCKVYSAPFDVRLANESNDDDKIKNVVQPDITVICDKNKLDDKGAIGAPDFIVEIVSKSSVFLDYVKKLNLYSDYGVKEYWIVEPVEKTVLVYKIDETGNYGKPISYNRNDEIKVGIFDNLIIDLKTIFEYS